ncbi:Uma2 family endonuclease [Actinomadura fibrosa]|uniref:Uma2 family endonuclease n=1 Tax=Actinomadura fibrosa TaxID=111802 RepID=A0ABW2XQK7_9ACTN|nr:Uma2 family endonuclease [Actinomadura fibrosa]
MKVTHGQEDLGPYTADDLHDREDEGRGRELENGWLLESSPSAAHNWAVMRVHDLIRDAVSQAGAAAFVAAGGWEVTTPAGIRKPDVFAIPRRIAKAAIVERDVTIIPGHELLLVVEVVSSPGRSERTDRVCKLKEYAALGIPQYWIVDYTPVPKVQVYVQDDAIEPFPLGRVYGSYRLDQVVEAGNVLEVEVEADKPFTVRFAPQVLTEF